MITGCHNCPHQEKSLINFWCNMYSPTIISIAIEDHIKDKTCPDMCPRKKEIEANIMREKLKQL